MCLLCSLVTAITMVLILARMTYTRAREHHEVAAMFDAGRESAARSANIARPAGGGLGGVNKNPNLDARGRPRDPAFLMCGAADDMWNVEYGGDVVATPDVSAAAAPGNIIRTPTECCIRCAKTKGCNLYVFGGEGRRGTPEGMKCWLKHTHDPKHPVVRAEGEDVGWTSGALMKDYDAGASPGAGAGGGGGDRTGSGGDVVVPGAVALDTPAGRIEIELMPGWHAASVAHVARLARERGSCENSCHLYRAEPGFLLQGTLKSFSVRPNEETKRGPKVMERGEIGWAGEGAGPDFFVYLGDRPATHWGTGHTVWGKVTDEWSLRVADAIVNGPSHTPGGEGTMRFLKDFMYFDVVESERPPPSSSSSAAAASSVGGGGDV